MLQPKPVEAPEPGDWVGVGGPNEATASPPLRTGTDQFLVGRTDGSTMRLIRVDAAGTTADLGGFAPGATATFTRGDAAWVAVVEGRDVTLVSSDGSQTLPLGSLVPEGHVVVAAG